MKFNCIEQTGGFKNIKLFTLEETDNWPLVLTDNNSNEVEFNPNDAAVDAILRPGSIKVEEKPEIEEAGELWEVEIEFIFSMQSQALQQLLDKYKNHPGVVEVCKHYGQRKLYGTDKHPLRMHYELLNGEDFEDGQEIKIIIEGNVPQRAVYLNS